MTTIFVPTPSGGMTNDGRDPVSNRARILEHFDAFTNPKKLTPYRSAESGDSSASSNGIANYEYVNGTLYGLGLSGTSTKIFTHSGYTGASWSADGVYSLAATRADIDLPAFKYYKTTGKLYGVRSGRYVWSVVPATSATVEEADLTAYSHVSNMLVHSKDDVLYLGYDNKIASNNNGTWDTAALTLPSDYIVTSICEYGNYLAIAARPNVSARTSRVWLWNRDDSLTTLSESIDWGEGNLMLLEEQDGYLVGVSFVGDDLTASALQSRVAFKAYANGAVETFQQFVGFSQTPAVVSTLFKRKVNGRILFSANIPIGTTGYGGVWAIGRSSPSQPFTVTLDRLPASLGSSFTPYGFIQIGDYVFFSYTNNIGGTTTFAMDKTDDASTYTTASLWQTTINPAMAVQDRQRQKQLAMAALCTEPLTSGQQALLKYRVDGGAWTTIMTVTATGSVVAEKPFDATGNAFAIGREYEFDVESTGGAEITGIIYKYTALNTFI